MKIRTRVLASRYGKEQHSTVDVTRIYDYLKVLHSKNLLEWEKSKVKDTDITLDEVMNPYVRSILDTDELFSAYVGTPLSNLSSLM